MSQDFKGKIDIDVRQSIPDWQPYMEPKAPDGAPNVLFIVWDDTGFGAWDTYGGLIEMPTMRRIAERGLLYTQFHTTALCSPSRSCILNGRNATSNGMACIEEATTGFPGSNGRIPFENALISEVLAEKGYNTYALGKWHLTPTEEGSMATTKRNWPLGRGFERYYGFLGGETDQWHPDLMYDNHPVEPPATPAEGYHLSSDLVDKAIQFIGDAKVIAPEKPFFMYFCPGANHAPHHSPTEWTERYHGKFDMGYEKYREIVIENEKRLGLIPQNTELPSINPYEDVKDPDGNPWPEQDSVRPWDELSEDEKRLFCRMAEVYAGFSSYTDHQIGRLIDYLEELGQLDNTIIVWVSDNGASAEGGPNGSVNEGKFFNGIIDTVEEGLKYLDVLGTEKTYNHYPTGWAMAFGTPYKMFKRYSGHQGGTSDPFLISWPKNIPQQGVRRDQYLHAIDIVPTIYDLLGIEPPSEVKGYTQNPIEGRSFRGTFADASAPAPRDRQFYMMLGTRGIWANGWMANAVHPPVPANWGRFESDRWELFNLDDDRNQLHDLASEHPDLLEKMKNLWFMEAGQYNGLPLDDRDTVGLLGEARPQVSPDRERWLFYPGLAEVPERAAVQYHGRSFSVLAEVDIEDGNPAGVLFSHGGRFGGHSLFVKDGRLHYSYNWLGETEQRIVSPEPVPSGAHIFGVRFRVEGRDGISPTGPAALYIDDHIVAEQPIKTQPGHFSLAGEGINVGRDGGQPVSSDYDSPFQFTGGKIKKVTLDASGERFRDIERELAAMVLARE